LSEVNHILSVEEPRDLANLLKIGVTESLLDNNVDQVLADGVVLILELAIKLNNALS
jgi:hypothetical protein